MTIIVSIIIFIVFLGIAPRAIKYLTLWVFTFWVAAQIIHRLAKPFYAALGFDRSAWNDTVLWLPFIAISIPALIIIGIIAGIISYK